MGYRAIVPLDHVERRAFWEEHGHERDDVGHLLLKLDFDTLANSGFQLHCAADVFILRKPAGEKWVVMSMKEEEREREVERAKTTESPLHSPSFCVRKFRNTQQRSGSRRLTVTHFLNIFKNSREKELNRQNVSGLTSIERVRKALEHTMAVLSSSYE